MQKTFFKNENGGTRYCFLLLSFFMISQFALAQTQVKGIVNDSNGVTLPGVSILEKGTNNGVVTDFDGVYSITVKEDAILVFSYIGFEGQEISTSNKTTINVTLKESFENLDEVVVIGYGTQTRENISGSVSSVETKDLKEIPQVSVDQLLQGRAAGVTVTANSGQPGSSMSVRIRGLTSITGSNEPLYIIDGVPISGESQAGLAGGSQDNNDVSVSPLAILNPSDIASIDILKDASATAIYGSRGANGVVIITTKKGKSGEGKLEYSTYVGLQEPTKLIEMMKLPEYAKLQNVFNRMIGITPNLIYDRPELLGPGTDWQKEIFKKAFMTNHQVAFSGGNDRSNYYFSASSLDQDGIAIGSGFNRLSVRANINGQIKDWIKAGINLSGSRTKDKFTYNNNGFDGVISSALLQSPNLAVYNADGTFAGPVDDSSLGQNNPVALALSVTNKLRRDNVGVSFYTQLDLTEDLNFRTEVGTYLGSSRSHHFRPTYQWGRYSNEINELTIRENNSTFWNLKNMLTYDKNFGKHYLNVLVAHEAQENAYQGTVASAKDLISNEVQTLNLGDAELATNSANKASSSLMSYLSRAIYGFDDRYNITASIRADRSSNFAQGNQWGYFPSVSASWKLSNEEFMQNTNGIQDIKIYGGYGQTGNQNIPGYLFGGRLGTLSTEAGTGFPVQYIQNPELQWETSEQTNLGLEFTLFDKRLKTIVEVYDKTSANFLYQAPLPIYLIGGGQYEGGIGAPWVNIGEMSNKGVDLTLNYQTKGSGDFSWDSNLTLSHYKNEVVSLLNGADLLKEVRNWGNASLQVTNTREGQPIAMYYGLKVKGLFNDEASITSQPIQYDQAFSPDNGNTWLGDVQYEDISGPDGNPDGVIDDYDLTEIGNPHPDITFGFNNNFSYKNFDLSIMLQGTYGNDVMNIAWLKTTSLDRRYNNQTQEATNYWTPENTNTNIPRPVSGNTNNNRTSERFIEDGSYLRIQNVRLGYNFKQDLLDRLPFSKLKIYGVIQNLYTFSNYKGYDPEVGNFNQNALLSGIDNGRYPTPRTFTLGLNIEF
ncbi:SusC/RagA family TonB-linked outer membrane protein [Thalassobellus citreus]|uniref:SusC/RagA family TonB-linked outer membrane protein n=1 Tax=Thalassobellus citreus TaxID=3367752 RepID=UPI00379264D0